MLAHIAWGTFFSHLDFLGHIFSDEPSSLNVILFCLFVQEMVSRAQYISPECLFEGEGGALSIVIIEWGAPHNCCNHIAHFPVVFFGTCHGNVERVIMRMQDNTIYCC